MQINHSVVGQRRDQNRLRAVLALLLSGPYVVREDGPDHPPELGTSDALGDRWRFSSFQSPAAG